MYSSGLPLALYRSADVRELDRRAIEVHGIPAVVLMERAGQALFRVLRNRFPAAGKVLVLCGGGNNGGDGYVLARLARAAGLDVRVLALASPGNLRGAAATAQQAYAAAGGGVGTFSSDAVRDTDVIVDALFGIGLDRTVEGEAARAITAINAAHKPVIAADIPSGLHADTGAVLGAAMRTTITVSFIGLKAGLFTGRGPAVAGEIVFSDLDIPPESHRDLPPVAERLDATDLHRWLPARERDAHKGDFGQVTVLGGGAGMPGAARLAGEAALRAGAGRVTAAVWPENVAAIAGARPELMCLGISTGADLLPVLERSNVLLAGPGLGRGAWSEAIWQSLRHRGIPEQQRILDADALYWLARHSLSLNPGDVITPHPGEAARLLDCRVADIEADRFASVRALSGKYGCIAVLKGAGTLIAAPEGRISLCDRGNPGMASAGTGDVLAGIIAGLRAQGAAAFDAARAGVLVHAMAGDRAARGGERGMLAGDLLDEVRRFVNHRKLVEQGKLIQ